MTGKKSAGRKPKTTSTSSSLSSKKTTTGNHFSQHYSCHEELIKYLQKSHSSHSTTSNHSTSSSHHKIKTGFDIPSISSAPVRSISKQSTHSSKATINSHPLSVHPIKTDGSVKTKKRRVRRRPDPRCTKRENIPLEATISWGDISSSHHEAEHSNDQILREFSRTNMSILKGTGLDPEAFLVQTTNPDIFFLERQVNAHKIYRYMTDYMDQYYDLSEDRNPFAQWRENMDDRLYDTFAYVIPILCSQVSRDVLRQEPMVVTTAPDVIVFGDIHGNLNDIYYINKHYLTSPKYANFKFIFLGDYVDRGSKSIETIIFLFSIKLINPKRFILLRGNHEVSKVNRKYGFKRLVEHLYNDTYISMPNTLAQFIYYTINQAFNNLPYAAVIRIRNQKGIFCCHGGVPNETYNNDKPWKIEELNRLAGSYKPHDMIPRTSSPPEQSALNELLWNDPISSNASMAGTKRLFYPNPKRGGHCSKFTEDAANRFLNANNCRLLIRGHQFACCKDRGYHYHFDGQILTVFSSSNYCGMEENCTGYVYITEEVCEPRLLRSADESTRYQQFNHFELVTNHNKEVTEVLF